MNNVRNALIVFLVLVFGIVVGCEGKEATAGTPPHHPPTASSSAEVFAQTQPGTLPQNAGSEGTPSAQPATAPAQPPRIERVVSSEARIVLDAAKTAMDPKNQASTINTMRFTYQVQLPTFLGETLRNVELLWSRKGGRIVRYNTVAGQIEMGTDGTRTWKRGMSGDGDLTEVEKKQIEQAGMFIATLAPEDPPHTQLARIELGGTSVVEGREYHKLLFVPVQGEQTETYYDAATGLPAKIVSPEGQTTFSDWREINGYKLFRIVSIEQTEKPSERMTIRIADIEINKLSDHTFADLDQMALDRAEYELIDHFTNCGDSFYSRVWDGKKWRLLQYKNAAPKILKRSLNEGDRLNGVEWSGTIEYSATVLRSYAPTGNDASKWGWTEWRSSVYNLWRVNLEFKKSQWTVQSQALAGTDPKGAGYRGIDCAVVPSEDFTGPLAD